MAEKNGYPNTYRCRNHEHQSKPYSHSRRLGSLEASQGDDKPRVACNEAEQRRSYGVEANGNGNRCDNENDRDRTPNGHLMLQMTIDRPEIYDGYCSSKIGR